MIENYVDAEGKQQRAVFMPTYAEGADGERRAVREKLDAGARAIWEDLDFRVETVSGAEDLAYGIYAFLVNSLNRGYKNV